MTSQPSKQDAGHRQLDHAKKVIGAIFVPDYQSSEVLNPRKEPFDLPTASISTQGTAILCFASSIAAMWSDQFHSPRTEFSIKPIRIVGVVSDKVLGGVQHDHLCQRLIDQRHLVRRGACKRRGHLEAVAICHDDNLRAFASLDLTDMKAPFLRGGKGRVDEDFPRIQGAAKPQDWPPRTRQFVLM
jgi:hypothetical protein